MDEYDELLVIRAGLVEELAEVDARIEEYHNWAKKLVADRLAEEDGPPPPPPEDHDANRMLNHNSYTWR